MMTVRSASGRPVRGSTSSRELVDHVGHLVASLAAADVDDDVGVAPLGDLLQQHRLAGAEAAGHGGGAAAGDREEQVEDALPGEQRRGAVEPPTTGRGRRTGQRCDQPDVRARRRRRRSVVRDLGPRRRSSPAGPTAPAGRATRCSTAPASRHGPEDVARRRPGRRPRRSGTNAPRRAPAVAAVRVPGRQPRGAAVSGRSSPSNDAAEQARAERRRQRLARVPADRGAGREPAGVLVGLDGGQVAVDRHHLAGQPAVAQLDDLGHRDVRQALGPRPAVRSPRTVRGRRVRGRLAGSRRSTARDTSASRRLESRRARSAATGRAGASAGSATTPPARCPRDRGVADRARRRAAAAQDAEQPRGLGRVAAHERVATAAVPAVGRSSLPLRQQQLAGARASARRAARVGARRRGALGARLGRIASASASRLGQHRGRSPRRAAALTRVRVGRGARARATRRAAGRAARPIRGRIGRHRRHHHRERRLAVAPAPPSAAAAVRR